MPKRIVRWVRGKRRRGLAFVVAVITGLAIALLTDAISTLADTMFPGDPLTITVERDPNVFDATEPVDWERYDYVVRGAESDLPPPPKGPCRERFEWAQGLDGRCL